MKANFHLWICCLAVLGGCSKPAPPLTTKSYPIGPPYQLTLSFPATWKDDVVRLQESLSNFNGTFDGILFTPTNAERCAFRIELIPLLGTNTPPPDLKSALLQGSPGDLTNSVETAATPREVEGAQASGYYFRVTDRRFVNTPPTPPDFKYLTQGLAHVGPLILNFRLVNDGAASEEEALDVIRTARITRH